MENKFNNNVSCDVFIGKGAGASIKESFKNAKKSVTIISPFLSGNMTAQEIIKLLDNNVKVSIVTKDHFRIYPLLKEVISKNPKFSSHGSYRSNVSKLFLTFIFATITLLLINILLSFEFNFSFIKNITINSQIFLVVFLIIINIFLLKKTSEIDFEYSIRKNLNLHILKKGYPLHSKIYIIDNKIAYLGSLNCTDSGFRYNHETRIKTKDKKFISDLNKLYKEFLELPAIPLKTLQKNIKTFSKKGGFDDESYTFYE